MEQALKLLYEANNAGIRIWVQNNALKFKAPEGADTSSIIEKLRVYKQELIILLIENKITDENISLPYIYQLKTNKAPLSFAQSRLWFIEQYEGGTNAYNAPVLFELDTDVVTEGVYFALDKITERHEIFRTKIEYDHVHGSDIQMVCSDTISVNEITCLEDNYEVVIREMVGRPFDLRNEFPVKIYLYNVKMNNGSLRRFLLINMHHIASDGWSVNIIISELQAYYDAYIREDLLFDFSVNSYIKYKDYAFWQREYLKGSRLEEHLRFWKEKLSGYRLLQLRTDFTRPALRQYEGAQLHFSFGKEISNSLRIFAKNEGVTLFSVLLSGLNILLSKYSAQDDIIIGTPVANRSHRQTDKIIGFFVNVLAQRTILNKSGDFRELVQQVHLAMKETQQYQNLPFEMLVNELGIEPDTSMHPVFQVILEVQNFGGVGEPETERKKMLKPYSVTKSDEPEKFDLSFFINDGSDEITGVISYATSLFREETISRLKQHFVYLFSQLLSQPNIPYSGMSLLPPREQIMIDSFSDVQVVHHEKYDTVIGLFKKMVLKQPDDIAIKYNNIEISYLDLDKQSDKLAFYLAKNYSSHKENLVGILLDRSDKMIISVLAVLKSGAAYIPVDPSYPDARRKAIIEESGLNVLLTQMDYFFGLDYFNGRIIALDIQQEQLEEEESVELFTPLPDDLAYVIYTSGSTGKPKGCCITHKNLSHYIQWADNYYFDDLPTCNFGLFTSLSFDLTVTSIFCCLTKGGCLTIYPQNENVIQVLSDCFKKSSGINCIKLTPSHIRLLDQVAINSDTMKCIIIGGEAVGTDHLKILHEKSPGARLYNEYGPTETTVGCVVKELKPHEPVVIGTPIQGVRIYILDERLKMLPVGVPGEIFIAGDNVGSGYLNNADLTCERFLPDIREPGKRMYKTGDIGCWLHTGEIDYLGRADDQVKINGYRIELGEIESVISKIKGVAQSVVITKKSKQTENTLRLIAYYIPSGIPVDESVILNELKLLLPEYMIPDTVMAISSFPFTVNGKLDKTALPEPETDNNNEKITLPKSDIERTLNELYAGVLKLDPHQIGIHSNFFKIGGNSLLTIQLNYKLNQLEEFKHITVADLFRYNTIHKLIESIRDEDKVSYQILNKEENMQNHDIAIIAISGAFSGGENINDYWKLIAEQQEGVRFYTKEECEEWVSSDLLSHPDFIPVSGQIPGTDLFDPLFWGISPNEARIADPQIRKFMEHCWYAIESSGYSKNRKDAHIGVFAGSGSSNYLHDHLLNNNSKARVSVWEAYNANSKDALATKVAYHLGLTGPAVAVNTACSTGLVAVVEACKNIQQGICDMALAGGVSLFLPEDIGYLYEEDMITSKDGHCRTFDKKASGTVGGSGVGVVLLKKMQDAIKDNDHIWGVIRGYAVNNDGDRKVGYAAPSVTGQAECIMSAQKMAAVNSDQVEYVECHGTGTLLGDPIEIKALTEAFKNNNSGKENSCKTIIGAVKANIGHTDAAAGIAGLIKVCLMMKNNTLPGQVNYVHPNHELHLESSPFEILTENKNWTKKNTGVRIAGVSSFGIGGTNAHIILADCPDGLDSSKFDVVEKKKEEQKRYIIPVSGKTKRSTQLFRKAISDYLSEKSESVSIKDIAYTLQERREMFQWRTSCCANNLEELILELKKEAVYDQVPDENRNKIVFVFPGQGTQYRNMAIGLYENEPDFAAILNTCVQLVHKYTNTDILNVLYSCENISGNEIDNTKWTQLTLFVVEYALAKYLEILGVKADAYLGHSIGEYVAAVLSGVFDLEDAIKLVVARGSAMQKMKPGNMLSVFCPVDQLKNYISDLACDIAVVNSSQDVVVSGTREEISKLKERLDAVAVASVVLNTSHAFHSSMMEEAMPVFEEAFTGVSLNKPAGIFISNVTGEIASDEVCSEKYWSKQLRSTVLFSKGIDQLFSKYNGRVSFVEAGPGRGLSHFVRRHLDNKKASSYRTLSLLSGEKANLSEQGISLITSKEHLLEKLWRIGIIDAPNSLNSLSGGVNISQFPTYKFDFQKCWVPLGIKEENTSGLKLLSKEKWFTQPVWSMVTNVNTGGYFTAIYENALVIINRHQLNKELHNGLSNRFTTIVLDLKCDIIKCVDESTFYINPSIENHFLLIENELKKRNRTFDSIIHFSSLDNVFLQEEALYNSFYSLFQVRKYLVENLSVKNLLIVTNGLSQISDKDIINPFNGTLVGAVRNISHELPQIETRIIDIGFEDTQWICAIKQIHSDIVHYKKEHLFAYRYGKIWEEAFKSIQYPLRSESQIIDEDVLLITGGTGGIALDIALKLSAMHSLKFVLISRSAEFSIRTNPQKESIINKIRENGSVVRLADADLSDDSVVEKLISDIRMEFGRIDGIIHTAGILPLAPEKTDLEKVIDSFKGKVIGVDNLLRALQKEDKIRFVASCSSLSSVMGDINRIEYCASNSFLDYLSAERKKWSDIRFITINWPGWLDVGMSVAENQDKTTDSSVVSELQRLMNLNTLSAQEGTEIFINFINQVNYRQIAVSKYDVPVMVDHLFKITDEEKGESNAELIETEYSEDEYKVACIITDVLGLSGISVHDDFFHVGGNSISAIQVSHRIAKTFKSDIKVADIFKYKTVSAIAANCIHNGNIIIPVNKSVTGPLSFAQERLWFIEQFEEGSNAYHIPTIYELNGEVNIEGLRFSFQKIVERHEVLRSTVSGEEVSLSQLQYVHNDPLIIREVEIAADEVKNVIEKEVNRPFDLASEYPVRVSIFHIAERVSGLREKSILLINLHHIAGDGWSLDIFRRELFFFYDQFIGYKDCNTVKLPDPEIQYKDYAGWQRSYLNGDRLERQLQYWKEMLQNVPALELPYDFKRPDTVGYKGAYKEFKFSSQLSEEIRIFAKKQGTTVYNVILGSLNIFLSKYSGQDDVIIGSPTANRHHQQTENVIGFFVNMLAHRTRLEKNESFTEIIHRIHKQLIDAQQNQDLPFEKLVDELGMERDTSKHPVFQVMFALQNLGNSGDIPEHLKENFVPFQVEQVYEVEKFDLSVYIDDTRDEITGQFSYAVTLFKEETIEKFVMHYIGLVEKLIVSPDTNYSQVGLLNSDEYNRITEIWNNTEKEFSRNKTIHDLFQEQVARTPENIALIFGEKDLTYKEYDEKTNQLANYIRSEYLKQTGKNLSADTLIPVCIDRSLEMMIGIMAILKSGAAYVPVDTSFPQERIDFILEDISCDIILTTKSTCDNYNITFPDVKLLLIDLDVQLYGKESSLPLPVCSEPHNLAYVIYTSGTTGHPKGTMLNHNGIVNRIEWMQSMYTLNANDIVLQKTPYVFDVSVWEIFWGNWFGSTIILAQPHLHKDSASLHELIEKKGVTTLHFVPSMLDAYNQYLLASDSKFSGSVRQLFCSGEALSEHTVGQTYRNFNSPHTKLHNLYGPTEASVDVTYYETIPGVPVLIGKPIDNTKVYILDQNNIPVPVGVPGELFLGGIGLSRGYLNKSELTAERFVKNFMATSQDVLNGYDRLYKTGDVVKWTSDGNIEYIGRNDDQIKIRGFRIELKEIESALMNVPGIIQCCVMVKERNTGAGITKYIAGYFCSQSGEDIASDKILEELSVFLPEYMLPSILIRIDSFPVTINGKMDKKALPEPEFNFYSCEIEQPFTEEEKISCEIWKQILGIENIGVTDDFFRSGGNSILAIHLSHRMSKELHCNIKVVDIFRYKNIRNLLEHSLEKKADEKVKLIF